MTRIFKMSRNVQGLIVLAKTLRKSVRSRLFRRSAAREAGRGTHTAAVPQVTALVMLFLFVLMTLIIASTLMYNFEGPPAFVYDEIRRQYPRPDGTHTPFETIFTTMWWCVVTMTTVGYGDLYPTTPVGQIIATITMFWGLIVLSLPITIIGANFDEEYREMRRREHVELVRKKKEQAAEVRVGNKFLMLRAASTGQSIGRAPDPDDPIVRIQRLIQALAAPQSKVRHIRFFAL